MASDDVWMLRVDAIEPDPEQPRTEFREGPLKELALSLRRDGVLQHAVVRPIGEGRWRLIAGERRWRAAKLAGLTEIPCLVREVTDAEAFELALVENLLRENLDPLDEGRAFRRLMVDRGWSLLEVAQRVKKDTAYVEYRTRLVNLLPEYQAALQRGILGLPQACDLARVPPAEQPRVFRLYQRGVNPNEVARVITAILEQGRQPLLPGAAETSAAANRFTTVLRAMARQLGGCYSRENVELLSWVTTGDVEQSLELVGLLVKQLRLVEDALRRAKARREVRSQENSLDRAS